MTTYNKTTLKTFFQTGDVPTGTDYANFIDSYINIVETSEQSLAGNLSVPEIIAARVSAANVNITGILSAATINLTGDIAVNRITASAASFNNTVSAANLIVSQEIRVDLVLTAASAQINGNVACSGLRVNVDVSATNGSVYTSALRSTRIYAGVGIVSAAGTTQGAAAILTNTINRGKGVADGTTTGFAPPGNNTGMIQYLFNEGVSANLWPPTGGFINGLAVNTPFPLAASSAFTIFHLTASSMAVK